MYSDKVHEQPYSYQIQQKGYLVMSCQGLYNYTKQKYKQCQ